MSVWNNLSPLFVYLKFHCFFPYSLNPDNILKLNFKTRIISVVFLVVFQLMYITQLAQMLLVTINPQILPDLKKILISFLVSQLTILLLLLWLLPFSIFILPKMIRKFTNFINEADKAIRFRECRKGAVLNVIALDASLKIILAVASISVFENFRGNWEFPVRYLAYYFASTLETTFIILSMEIVARLKFFKKRIKKLKSATQTNSAGIQALVETLELMKKAKTELEKKLGFFLLINAVRHFLFLLSASLSSYYSSNILTFAALIVYSLLHYSAFTWSADVVAKEVKFTKKGKEEIILNETFREKA